MTIILLKFFFKDFDESKYNKEDLKDVKADREKNHFDLCFELTNIAGDKEFFIIEYKIKSLATIGQLKKYTGVLAKRGYTCDSIHAIYTGIEDSLTEDQIDSITEVHWSFKSYEEIGSAIKNVVCKIKTTLVENKEVAEDDDNERILENINEYADTVVKMSHILSSLLEESNDKFTYKTKRISGSKLDEHGLYDVYNKLKGCEFLAYVRGELKKDGIDSFTYGNDTYVIYCESSFHRKKVTLDIRWCHYDDLYKKNTGDGERVIGIQIESLDYRFVFGMPLGKANTGEIFNNLSKDEYGWFDKDYSKTTKILKVAAETYKSSMKGKYCSYGGSFVHQYYNLPGKDKGTSPLTYKELYERIKGDLKRAEEIIKKMPLISSASSQISN